jgi:Protein of unknown function (DUF4242)
MKPFLALLSLLLFISMPSFLFAQTKNDDTSVDAGSERQLFIDVHSFSPGKVDFKEIASAHLKDVEVGKKYGVTFLKYWVDEKDGLIYCLSSARDSGDIRKTHGEAHGMLPQKIYMVTSGLKAIEQEGNNYFLDIHELGAGNVTAADVANAHQKDLEVQKNYRVNFINYWVDESAGVVLCLSQAQDATSVIKTHSKAHGLIPVKVLKVKQGE